MGTLKPGATYVYERVEGITYAREMGADPSTRRIVGWEHKEGDGRTLSERIAENHLWEKILIESRTNEALRHALDQCIIIYNLSIEHGT